MRTTFGSPGSTNPNHGSSAVSHSDVGSSSPDDSASVARLRNGVGAPHRTRLDAHSEPDSLPVADVASIAPEAVTAPPASVALPTGKSGAPRITGKRRPDPDGEFQPVPLAERLALQAQGRAEAAADYARRMRGGL